MLSMHGFPMGGGSYQRLLPASVVTGAVGVRRRAGGALLPFVRFRGHAPRVSGAIRSLAVAKQLVGRGRVARVFSRILSRYGSKACAHVEW